MEGGNFMENNIIPEEVKQLKTQNNWLGILQYYNMQYMDSELPNNVSLNEQNEILFAAKHWCNNLHALIDIRNPKDKPKAIQVLSGYVWTFTSVDKIYQNNQNDLLTCKTYAYIYYEIYNSLGYNLNKMAKKFFISGSNSAVSIFKMRKESFDNACNAYKKILKQTPEDIKSLYRFASINRKQLQNSAYKKKLTENKNWFNNAYDAYNTIFSICREGNKVSKGVEREFCRSLYGFANLIVWVCSQSIYWEQQIVKLKNEQKTYLSNPIYYGIKWEIDDIIKVRERLTILFSRLGYPMDLTPEKLHNIAVEKNPIILPIYPYYLLAKMHFIMGIVRTSSAEIFLKIWNQGARKIYDGYYRHIKDAIKYCRYSIDIKEERIQNHFSDCFGTPAQANLDLLMQLYSISHEISEDEISKYADRNKNRDICQFYYALYLYYQENVKHKKKGIEIMTKLAKNAKDNNARNRSQKWLTFQEKEASDKKILMNFEPAYKPQKKDRNENNFSEYISNSYTGGSYKDGEFYPDWLGGAETEDEFWEHTD